MITVDTNPPPACKRTKTPSKWQTCVLGATFMRRPHCSLYFCNNDKYVFLYMSCYRLWLTHRGGRPQSPQVSLRYHIHQAGACSDLWLPRWVFHVWAHVDFCITKTLTYDLRIMSPLIEILSKLLDENSDGRPNSEHQSKWEQAGRWWVVTGTIKSDAPVQVFTSEQHMVIVARQPSCFLLCSGQWAHQRSRQDNLHHTPPKSGKKKKKRSIKAFFHYHLMGF